MQTKLEPLLKDTRKAYRWRDLRAQINNYWRQKSVRQAIVGDLRPVDSKDHDPLQLTDLLLGAIGYDLDEYNTSQHRLEFVRHIARRIGCDQLRTHWGRNTRFNIWKFRFPETADAGEEQEGEKSDS